jgi:hypothetical protein
VTRDRFEKIVTIAWDAGINARWHVLYGIWLGSYIYETLDDDEENAKDLMFLLSLASIIEFAEEK